VIDGPRSDVIPRRIPTRPGTPAFAVLAGQPDALQHSISHPWDKVGEFVGNTWGLSRDALHVSKGLSPPACHTLEY